jgi:hypothetical protein
MHAPMIDRAHSGLVRIIAANDWRERPRNATFPAAAQNVLACSPTGQCSRAAPEPSSRSPLLGQQMCDMQFVLQNTAF